MIISYDNDSKLHRILYKIKIQNSKAKITIKIHKWNTRSKLETVKKTLLKIGPQCVLGVLCLNLFLSVGMLFSPISILEFELLQVKR